MPKLARNVTADFGICDFNTYRLVLIRLIFFFSVFYGDVIGKNYISLFVFLIISLKVKP